MALKKIIFIAILLFFVFFATSLFPGKAGALTGIGRPGMLDIDGGRFYVVEGPQEFDVSRFTRLNARPDDLRVISVGSVFSR